MKERNNKTRILIIIYQNISQQQSCQKATVKIMSEVKEKQRERRKKEVKKRGMGERERENENYKKK